MTRIINEWRCLLCGADSKDIDQQNITFEEHLNHHRISIAQYNDFIYKNNGGISNLKVKLLNWSNNIELSIISFISQTWGPIFDLNKFNEREIEGLVLMALEGKTLPLALESIQFTFQIDNLSRASSHQLVRVRVGSAFSQRGMSDSYYGNIQYIIPASVEMAGKTDSYIKLMNQCSEFYKELFESGVPYQDARFVIPHAASTSLVWSVNLLALKNFCAQRMSCTQSWEMNALCKMLRDEVATVYPIIANYLVPKCEVTGKCASFGNLFKGCGKFPMDDSNRKFVFDSKQMAKNLCFDDDYREWAKEYNEKVKENNNYFLEKVKGL